MGLLDNVIGALGAGGGGQGGGNPLVGILLQMLAGQGGGAQGGAMGGLGSLLSQFEHAGLGQVAQSWVGTGANQPISADQILSVLGGGGQLGQIAAQLGLSHQDAAHQVSQVLPQIVDKLTPQGQLPASGGLDIGQMLSMLGGLGGGR